MMSGLVSACQVPPRVEPRSEPRRYAVVGRCGGWSIVLNNGACTRPFRSRRAAERIAKSLQKQADGLDHTRPVAPRDARC